MDYSSPAISLLIVWYGVYEYRRRERVHSAAMEHLRCGEIPATDVSKPRPWSLLATGSVCALLAGFAGLLFFTGVDSRNRSDWPLELMGGMMTVPLLILLLIFARDVRQHTRPHSSEKEPER
jgi:hypothetical protein